MRANSSIERTCPGGKPGQAAHVERYANSISENCSDRAQSMALPLKESRAVRELADLLLIAH